MRPTPFRSIAAVSALLLLSPALEPARRPRYGGELRIEIRSGLSTIDSAEAAPADAALLANVFETLVRFDEHGQPQPWLATGWIHDSTRKCWVFTARKNVLFHNDSVWEPPDGVIRVPDKKPIAEILRDLSQLPNAIVVRGPDGQLLGTGPLRIADFEPGKRIRLEAHEDYWGGRPFLDAIEIRTVAGVRERLLDLDLGKTDVAEAEVTEVRRLQQKATPVEISKPSDALVLQLDPHISTEIREALALAIDRSAIQRVLLDRQGEISGALLPQWLSGYAFLFSMNRDVSRARALAGVGRTLNFAYDREDPLMRAIEERIAVNANDAGLVLRYATGNWDVRLRRLPLASFDPMQALEEYAAMLGSSLPRTSSPYEAEHALLSDFRIIPLFHLPAVYAMRANVRNWSFSWRLDNVWLAQRAGPGKTL